MRKKQTRTIAWQGHVESLEPRAVMSADPLAQLTDVAIEHQTIDELPSLVQHVDLATPDFWITPEDQAKIVQASSGISPMLASAHATTGWNTVQTNYGFNGRGQTVAVIDSGITYSHYALGGGLGSNHRVVGGWDFTEENDGDIFDDGPSGGHGTHVAGIIGSTDAINQGVASGVD